MITYENLATLTNSSGRNTPTYAKEYSRDTLVKTYENSATLTNTPGRKTPTYT